MTATTTTAFGVVGAFLTQALAAVPNLPAPQGTVTLRSGLPNLCRTLSRGEQTRVVYVGGGAMAGLGASTGSACYRAAFGRRLKKEFPKANFRELDCAIPGTGSWLASFRATTEIVRHYIPLGLVVVEFASDDAAVPSERVLASVEGLVRQVRKAHPRAEIVFLYGLARRQPAAFREEAVPPAVECHEAVAAHYGLPSVDMGRAIAQGILSGDLRPDDVLGPDGYPTDRGHALCAECIDSMIGLCKAAPIPDGEPVTYELPTPLTPNPLTQAQLVPYERADLEHGWLGWQESPIDRFFHVVRCNRSGPTMTLRFEGDTVGVYGVVGPDSGDLEFALDGGAWRPTPVFVREAGTGYRPYARLLAEHLDPRQTHTLKLRVAAAVPSGSQGRWARIAFFLVNGKPVFEAPYAGMSAAQRIDAVYSTMGPVRFSPPTDRWQHLRRTMERLQKGGSLTIVMLGDSIVNDTGSSDYEHLLMRLYPGCKVKKVRSVRGSTGCWWYKEEGRVKEYVLDHNPDLLMIGGISQRGDIESIRAVIEQVRSAKPETEVLLMTGAFGRTDPRKDSDWTYDVPADGESYRTRLKGLALEEEVEFLDMMGPWGQYIRESEHAMGSYKRDRIHANDRGKQILGRILEAYFAPK